ncbi:MAG: hypothetical protein EOQ52_20545 [Mesorhizobium sp.]|uniref:hypothetical protein n=1 Tax=Mesorhizobium sp. TaxID=1871066 RepID=UPI000FE501B7|nr:hypothetical protein [Mesorhizobium sp.]RWB85941.1 MAG: hypothetical protein EOQ52_20545 [Mesorhizobium sp.]
MKASDLEKAVKLARTRAQNVAMRDRLAAYETLTLSIGDGGKVSEIVMSVSWVEDVRRALIADFNRHIEANDKALAELGVTP